MNALLEFDEKEFWIQLFSIVVRREEKTEEEDTERHSAPEGEEWCPGQGMEGAPSFAPRLKLGAE